MQNSTGLDDAAVADALRLAADRSSDIRAVFEAVRDAAGTLVDLRILYGNPAYWELIGIEPAVGRGREMAAVAPGIDWSIGLAARIFDAMDGGGVSAEPEVRFRPQRGPFAGQERVFETEFTSTGSILAARLRDITDDAGRAERQAAEARRTAAIARFLRVAVDPKIGRSDLLDILAAELADAIGGLCLIIVAGSGGLFVIAAADGGPAEAAARMKDSQSRTSIALADAYRDEFVGGTTRLNSPIEAAVRARIGQWLEAMGVPGDLAMTVNSTLSTAVMTNGQAVGRIHMARFDPAAPFAADDRETAEAISTAAALVLERRAIEDRLAATSARYEAVFEQAPVPMVAVNSDGSVRYNERALELFGRSREEMTRLAFQPNAPWIPPDEVERWTEMRRAIAAGEAVSGERLSIVRPDGERREIEGASIQIVGGDGRLEGVVTVLADLTDRLSLESQFRHAQKMEALGRLAGGIAHDFNNVLMAIGGFAELVSSDAREGRLVHVVHAEEIVVATRRAVELTARLTTFARREVAKVEPVDVAATVGRLLPMLGGLVPESIEIATQLDPVPLVRLDRSEFEQAIVNIVVNAVDAMPAGGRLVVEVGAIEFDADHVASHLGEVVGPHVSIAVSDTGTGMDDATRSRIFEPFYTTKGVGEGTGLGLAMVFAAIERARGTIWVYSELGHGTTFKIYLPAAESTATVAAEKAEERSEMLQGGSESILLLEDDALVRELLVTILREAGYDVVVAALPSDAIEAAAGRKFDLLISDMVMPEMMGDAVAARLRLAQPDLRVVLMSGYTAKAVELELGPRDSFLHKPMLPSEIVLAVREALDRGNPG